MTAPARTLRDLKGAVPEWQWRRAVRQAEFKEMSLGGIETDRTRSDLERDFLALCRRFDLPLPEVNVKVGRWTVDFLWRQERLAVETDSDLSERQVNDEPADVAADLRQTLAAD